MGRTVSMARNPLLGEDEGPITYVLPELPREVTLTSSDAVTAALCDASRAIGRLEGARRAATPWHQCAAVLASFEGWACVLAADRKVSWSAVSKEFSDPQLSYSRGTTDARVAARLIGFHAGLEGFMDRSIYTGVVSSPLCEGELVSPRFRYAFEEGVDQWLEHGPGSGLVRAILVMMSMAASMPESDRLAMNARATFPWMARFTLGSDLMIPISAGFLGFRDEWDLVARALGDPHGYDSDTVNRAIEVSLRAVERASIAAAYEVEVLDSRGRGASVAGWLPTTIPSARYLFYLVNALPPVTREQLQVLSGLSARGVNKAIRILEDNGEVIVSGRVRGGGNYVVRSRNAWKPYPQAAQHHPSVSAAPEGQR